jgi:purine-cytosine permease-like protein
MGVEPRRVPEGSGGPAAPARHAAGRSGPELTGAGPTGADRAGFERNGFERNGVDRVPEHDRTSTPGTFFVIFIGGSVGLGAVSFGWVGLGFQLGLWATISAIAVGTAVGVALLVPLVLIGSKTATNNATSSGAMFGVRGRLIGSGIGLLTCLVSVALTVWTSGSAGVAVAGRLLGLPDSLGAQAVTYALVAAVSAAVAIWGYKWLVRATAIIFAVGGALMVLMPFAFAGRINWGYAGGEPVLGTFWATWLLVAVTVGVGGALVVCTIIGDWTRYISSERHPARSLAPVAALALFLGFAVPAAIGAIVATAFTDPAAPFPVSLAAESPLWYAVPLLPFAVLGGVGLVAQSLYSAGLDLEALVVRISRARATVIIAVVGVVLVYLGLLAPTIQGAIGAALLVLAELSAPWAVIVAIGYLRARGRFDPDDLQVFNRRDTGGRYWYSGGWNWPAIVAWIAGSIAGLLTIQTLVFSGPLSGIAAGVDVSVLLGAVVAAVIYLPFSARQLAPR